VMALAESGVPVISIPGHGYSLVEGYFLPPLTFNPDEAIMLLLGSDMAAQHFDAQYRSAAQSARHKIVTVLPDPLRREVDYLESSIQFVVINGPSSLETLQLLRRAILQHRTVRFRYHARYHNEQSSPISLRDADPYALVHIGGAWMLVAYCHLRRENRHFRLDRMEELVILNQTFTRPSDFKIEHSSEEDRTLGVRLLFESETAPRIKESPSAFQVAQAKHAEGLLVTLMVRQPGDILHWLLSCGSHVRVLEPESLCDLLTREAEGILKNHSRNVSKS
jgi:predicted DNA-binding transcriptional regulator YafY